VTGRPVERARALRDADPGVAREIRGPRYASVSTMRPTRSPWTRSVPTRRAPRSARHARRTRAAAPRSLAPREDYFFTSSMSTRGPEPSRARSSRSRPSRRARSCSSARGRRRGRPCSDSRCRRGCPQRHVVLRLAARIGTAHDRHAPTAERALAQHFASCARSVRSSAPGPRSRSRSWGSRPCVGARRDPHARAISPRR